VETLLDGETIFQTLRYGLELSRSDVESAFIRTDFATDGSATIFDRIGRRPPKCCALVSSCSTRSGSARTNAGL
jgi:hypothetical protein